MRYYSQLQAALHKGDMLPANLGKTIFVISPIGAEGSTERENADALLEYIITPVAEKAQYKVVRADNIADSGLITTQIFKLLAQAPIVIADMTGHNPNVFYELAVRHAAGMPVVHMITDGERIPFDVNQQRAIQYRLDLPGVKQAISALENMVASISAGDHEPDSPLNAALGRISLAQSGEPDKEQDSKVLEMLEDIRLKITNLDSQSRRSDRSSYDTLLESCVVFLNGLRRTASDDRTKAEVELLMTQFAAVLNSAAKDPGIPSRLKIAIDDYIARKRNRAQAMERGRASDKKE